LVWLEGVLVKLNSKIRRHNAKLTGKETEAIEATFASSAELAEAADGELLVEGEEFEVVPPPAVPLLDDPDAAPFLLLLD